jgi:cytochrome c biogenesis protein CcdA
MSPGYFSGAIGLFSMSLLLMAGLHFLRKRETAIAHKTLSRPFYLGIGLSVINVVAVPFWMVYTVLLSAQGWIRLTDWPGIAGYLAGIGVGAVLALELFAWFGHFFSRRFLLSTGLINRAAGIVMIGTALFQFLHFCYTRL